MLARLRTTAIALLLNGAYVSDLVFNSLQTAGGVTGISIDLTAANPALGYADDINFNNPIVDQWIGTGIAIQGPITYEGHLTINGGWTNPNSTAGTSYNMVLTNSYNVSISNHQFYGIVANHADLVSIMQHITQTLSITS